MQPQLILYHGNRLENLAEALAEVLREPLRSPFDRELIVVQSKGMERWIALQLATHWGICGNCEFPFPNALLQRLYGAVVGGLPERSPFDPELLLWRILQTLPEFIEAPDFAPLKRYLADSEVGALRRLQLCDRIARTFDHYLVYRQDLLQRWQDQPESSRRPGPEQWQARLWLRLKQTASDLDPITLTRRLFERLDTGGPQQWAQRERLPERLSVFGISYLPPLYLEVLGAVSRLVPVHLFVLNPCREYWFDIVSEAQRDHRPGPVSADAALDPDDLHLDTGHPLLASLGRQGRYFLGHAHELAAQTVELFDDPRRNTVLGRLQQTILELDPNAPAAPGPAAEDTAPSIQVHCCHSPMREVEVLHDRLLDLFARDPSLKPADVLVMTPDIETYAPYIQAVFDSTAEETARIPYSLSDRSARRETPEVEVLLTLLELAESRFSAPQVLDLLARPLVRAAFGIGAADLDTIVAWVRDSGIRWGMDEAHRQALELPPNRENSWRAGLDALLLGHALAPRGPELVAGISPAAGVDAGDGPLLGNLVWFVETLTRHLRSLAQPAPLAVWAERLLGLVDQFMSPTEADPIALDRLRAVVTELNDWQRSSGFSNDLEGPALRWLLQRRFDRGGAGFGFLGGGVTVCAMLPMRSIPFRVIGLLGLDHDAFPRRATPLSFDLMATAPRPGDPSPREDDRYLFLETLVSARDALHLSYVGQSVRDNSPAPPSVLVSELLDHLQRSGLVSPATRDSLIVQQRLHPFSPQYFRGGALFSYSADYCETAQELVKGRREQTSFCPHPLEEPDDSWRVFSVDDCCRFFAAPARTFLATRLKLRLDDGPAPLEDLEPFEWSGLDRYGIGDQLLRTALAGEPLASWRVALRSQGRLPHGPVGDLAFDQLSEAVAGFAATLKPHLSGRLLDPLPVDLEIGPFRLTGALDACYQQQRMAFRFGRIRAQDRLSLWIRHLLLAALDPPGYPRASLFIGRGKKGPEAIRFAPVTDPLPILERLTAIYWQGLRQPLPFFPESSQACAQKLQAAPGDLKAALAAARRPWQTTFKGNGERVPGECERNPYFEFVFGAADPFDQGFAKLAAAVFDPLLAAQAQEEVRR